LPLFEHHVRDGNKWFVANLWPIVRGIYVDYRVSRNIEIKCRFDLIRKQDILLIKLGADLVQTNTKGNDYLGSVKIDFTIVHRFPAMVLNC
jgi:hypothetical protein